MSAKGEVPTEGEVGPALERIVQLYPHVKPNHLFWTKEGGFKPENICPEILIPWLQRTIVNMDATPGLPWLEFGCGTVESVLVDMPHQLCESVRERMITRLSAGSPSWEWVSPWGLVESGFRDPVRVFIKSEPHSEKKLMDDRYRLIMNTSLTDIVCDRIVLETLSRAEVDAWETIPSKPGMGLDDRSIEKLLQYVPRNKKVRSSDVKAWDWSLLWWMFKACAEAEVRLHDVALDSELGRAILWSAYLTLLKVWVLRDGRYYEQMFLGAQESGSRPTAMRNSRIRVIMAFLAEALWAMAMGDDDAEVIEGDAVEAYRRFGLTVEYADLPPDVWFEFCSTWFYHDGRAKFQNHAKMFYRLLGREPDRLEWIQFCHELRASPEVLAIYTEWIRRNSRWASVV